MKANIHATFTLTLFSSHFVDSVPLVGCRSLGTNRFAHGRDNFYFFFFKFETTGTGTNKRLCELTMEKKAAVVIFRSMLDWFKWRKPTQKKCI